MDVLPPKSESALEHERTAARPGRSKAANLRDQVNGLWPTARTRGMLDGSGSRDMMQDKVANGELSETEARDMLGVALFPTVTARELKGARKPETLKASGSTPNNSLADKVASLLPMTRVAGKLNPAWVTAMMGFPPGWLDVELLPKSKRKSKRGVTGRGNKASPAS